MTSLDGAPFPLVAIAALGLLTGLGVGIYLAVKVVRRVRKTDPKPIGALRGAILLSIAAISGGAGMGAGGLVVALRGYRQFTKRTLVAELQCIELAPRRLRVFYVPISAKGVRGPSETYDVAGDEWTVGGDVLRFRPFLTALGVETVHKVTRIEGRWIGAKDANEHGGTAHDIGGGTTSAWLNLYRDGQRGPLRWFIDGAHGQAVSQLPDRRALFDLHVTPNGYVLSKRAL